MCKMSERTKLLKTCENSSPADFSVVYDVSLYHVERVDSSGHAYDECYRVCVDWPWAYSEKEFEAYSTAHCYYAEEAAEAIAFDFSWYDGRA